MVIGVNARLLHTPYLEGLGRYTWETVYAMAKTHPEDQFILFFDRRCDNTRFMNLPNISSFTLYCPTRHPIFILLWLEILIPIALWLKKVDVFYSADNFISLVSPKPTVMVCHDLAYLSYPKGISWIYRWFYKTMMPLYLKNANQVIAVSNFTKHEINTHFKTKDEVSVAYNALPTLLFTSKEKSFVPIIKNPYFIYVGSIHPRKNVDGMIHAFLNFKQQDTNEIKLVIIGRLAWKTNETKSLLQHDDIIHLENLNDEHVKPLLSKSIALLYVSNFEGFGIPILEGFNAGVPVITSSTSSMPEVAGDAALLVDPRDLKSISQAMHSLSTDSVLRADLVKKGIQRLKNFDWISSSDVVYQALEKAMK
jgi:glycosyltransferase involved in cell wall biosynthesis